MAKDYASQRLDRYIVKFPDGMRDELKTDAKANGRSLNAEIIFRLGIAKKIDNQKNKILNDCSNALSCSSEQEDSLKLAAKRLAWTIAENDVLRATEQIPQILSEMEKLKNNFLLKQLAEKRAALQKILDRTSLDLTDKQKVSEARRIAEIALLDAEATE